VQHVKAVLARTLVERLDHPSQGDGLRPGLPRMRSHAVPQAQECGAKIFRVGDVGDDGLPECSRQRRFQHGARVIE
jgi:hypothetical protein